jgi:uncharacterized protein YyaL (SSP411 family)
MALIFRLGNSALAEDVADTSHHKYETEAREVMQYIQQNLYDSNTGLYCHTSEDRHADFMWGNGITFTALAGASRYEPDTYLPVMSRFFKSMDRYWDGKMALPGYEPSPGNGHGNDKYYDDNEWMVLGFTEAYAMTHEPQYLNRAEDTLKFCLSGWDDNLGGGIWWHEGHKGGGKNTCSNAPGAVACLRVARFLPPEQAKSAVTMSVKIVDWTDDHLEASDNLFMDGENVSTEKKNHAKLTYNTALMIRADLGLYRWNGNSKYLQQAKASAKAADWFLDKKTEAYRDSIKWSHLMVEADLEMYRATHEDYLLARAKKNADHAYASWKANPPVETIDNASVARELYLLADTESDAGQKFWAGQDRVSK